MSTELSDEDINAVFDGIVLSENIIKKEGFNEGFKKGERDGVEEGYHLGFHKGIDIGTEIGYYSGSLEAWLKVSEKEDFSGRAKQVLFKLKELLQEFPDHNDPNKDILSLLENIRAKYKMVCSLLKVEPYIPHSQGYSF